MGSSSLELTDELPVLFFRVSCDLGFAFDPLQGELIRRFKASGPFALALKKSRHWLDENTDELAEHDYSGHLSLLRRRIEADLDSCPKSQKAFFKKLLGSIEARHPHELATSLQEMSDASHDFVGRALTSFGGSVAWSRWRGCERATLVFRHGERGGTRCTFARSPTSVITLHIGNQLGSHSDRSKGALRVYFNLRFYFFHEYLSHAFSVCQQEILVEGYLMWAAKVMMQRIAPDVLRRRFVEDTFAGEDHRMLRAAEYVSDWFHDTIGNDYLHFLLETAADQTPLDAADLHKLLDGLASYGIDNPQVVDRLFRTFAHRETAAIRLELGRLAEAMSHVPAFTPRLYGPGLHRD